MFKNRFKKMLSAFRKVKSLRFGIILIILVAGIVPMLVVGKVGRYTYETRAMEKFLTEATGQCNILATAISSSSYLKDQASEIVNAQIEQIAYTYSARVMVVDANFNIIKDSYVFEEGRILVTDDVVNAFSGKTTSMFKRNTGTGGIVIPITDGATNDKIGAICVSMVNYSMLDTLQHMNKVTQAIELGFILLIVIASIILSTLLISPIEDMQRAIAKVSYGSKKSRIPTKTLEEYNLIAKSVNMMLDRLQEVDDSREEFVANVSHELKTPMASMKVLADSLLSQDNVPEELYKEFLQDIVNEIDRENVIITDLLTLVKTDQSNAELNIQTTDVNSVVELVMKRLQPIAAERNVELILESIRPVAAQIDEVKFTLAITNLVENGIKYNVDGGFVRVSVNADHKFFYVKVSDSGIGIPENCKSQVFERFYRVDKARSRETGGTGLGLAITRNIILMHKGVIKLYSKESEGTTFTVRIPLNYTKGGGSV